MFLSFRVTEMPGLIVDETAEFERITREENHTVIYLKNAPKIILTTIDSDHKKLLCKINEAIKTDKKIMKIKGIVFRATHFDYNFAELKRQTIRKGGGNTIFYDLLD